MGDTVRAMPLMVVRVVDREGRPIGKVVQPRSAPVLGCGAGTVLLLRDQEAGERLGSRACA
jgi:hypothetical protein